MALTYFSRLFITKRKRAFAFFLFAFAFLSMLLLYLFFFNSGLDITMETGKSSQHFFVQNNSGHAIRDISIAVRRQNGNIEQLQTAKELLPQQKIELEMPEIEKEQVQLIASAPNHITVTRIVSADRIAGANLKIEAVLQDNVPVGTPITAKIKICNDAETINGLKVMEVHLPDYFEEQTETKKVTLLEGECQTLPFTLTPKKSGETTIYFKLTAPNVDQELEKQITITEN